MEEELRIERIHATNDLDSPTPLSEEQCGYISRLIYHTILDDIRNMRVLSSAQSYYLRTLPRDRLFEILDICNRIIENVKYAFEG